MSVTPSATGASLHPSTLTSAGLVCIPDVVSRAQKQVVCIAFGVRTASTLLCHDLAQTVGGHVHGELFQEHRYPTDPAGIAEYLGEAMASEPSDVFVVKMSWSQAFELRRRLAGPGGDPWDVSLVDLLPGVRFVHLRRLDKVAQTVSAWRAETTGQWHATGDSHVVPPNLSDFRPENLMADLLVLASEEHRWWTQFRDWDTSAFDVSYEQYVDDRLGTLRSLAAFLDIEPPDAITWPDPFRKLGDAATDAAVEQLRAHARRVLPTLVGDGVGGRPNEPSADVAARQTRRRAMSLRRSAGGPGGHGPR